MALDSKYNTGSCESARTESFKKIIIQGENR